MTRDSKPHNPDEKNILNNDNNQDYIVKAIEDNNDKMMIMIIMIMLTNEWKSKEKYATSRILHFFTHLFLLLITPRHRNIRWRLDVRDLSKAAGPPPPSAVLTSAAIIAAAHGRQGSRRRSCGVLIAPSFFPFLDLDYGHSRARHYPAGFVEMTQPSRHQASGSSTAHAGTTPTRHPLRNHR